MTNNSGSYQCSGKWSNGRQGGRGRAEEGMPVEGIVLYYGEGVPVEWTGLYCGEGGSPGSADFGHGSDTASGLGSAGPGTETAAMEKWRIVGTAGSAAVFG